MHAEKKMQINPKNDIRLNKILNSDTSDIVLFIKITAGQTWEMLWMKYVNLLLNQQWNQWAVSPQI
jgi:hypothetical protein